MKLGMAKAFSSRMNYYEKLVHKINQSMEAHPRSVMAMDMKTFAIIAKGKNLKDLRRKMPSSKKGADSVIFQKPSPKETWIL